MILSNLEKQAERNTVDCLESQIVAVKSVLLISLSTSFQHQYYYTPPGFFVHLIALIASLVKHHKCMKGSFHHNCITLFCGNISIGKLHKLTVSESLMNVSVSVTRQVERVNYCFSNAVKEIHSILVVSILMK